MFRSFTEVAVFFKDYLFTDLSVVDVITTWEKKLRISYSPPVLLFQWDGDSGARGTRQLLSQRTSGSRDPIIGEPAFLRHDKS